MPVGSKSNSSRSRRLSPRAGGSGCASHSGDAFSSRAAHSVSRFSRSSRADNCLASSSKALFSTGVSAGDFCSPMGRNGTTFSGISTGSSRPVYGEASSAIEAGVPSGAHDGVDDTTSDVAGGSAAATCRKLVGIVSAEWIGGAAGSAGESSTGESSAQESAQESSKEEKEESSKEELSEGEGESGSMPRNSSR